MESPTKEEKPLTIDKAAFLLLRVRRVFKKKIQTKKEKNYAQDVVFPKTADVPQITTPAKPAKKKGVPPLIRSRTVPAIIVPFSSILQAQLGKTANQAGSHQNKDVVSSSKSDFSTPGVDYVQFLTGSPPPTATSGTSGAYSPALHHRYSVHPGFGHPSLASRDSISGGGGGSAGTTSTITGGDCSSWNTSSLAPTSSSSGGGGTSAHFLSSSDCSLFQPACSLSGGGGGGVGGDGYLQHNSNPFLPSSPHPSSTGGGGSGRTFGRLSRLLNTPVENRRKSSTISLQNWHSSSAAAQAHHQRHHQHQQQPHPHHHHTCEIFTSNLTSASEFPNVCWTPASVATPRLARRRRSLEAEDLFRSRSVSIDSLLRTHFLDPDGTFKNFNKRLSTGSAHEHAGKNSQEEESLGELLDSMVHEAEKKTENLMARLLKCSTFGSLTSSQLKELEKEFHISEKRYKTLQKLRTDYAQIRVPDPPSKVTVDVIGTTAVRIRIQEGDNPEHSISTKYTIEWSQDEEFTTRTGSLEMVDLRKLETVVNDLVTGHRYYFRVCAGNCKGYGEYKNSTPASVIPSSWRDLDGKKSRYAGKSQIFDDIFIEIQKSRPEYASEIRSLEFPRPSLDTSSATSESGPNSGQSPVNIPSVVINQTPSQAGGGGGSGGGGGGQQKSKNQKIISIKQLFAAAPKFQKNFKRGVFLSCVIYSEDKLLVTNEEFLPAIEIDDSFPSSLHNDFHWLLKVASTWEDVKSFKADMEKSGSASTFHFRLKLLQATAVMQTALGVTDLGRLYYKTTRDKDNSVVVITTINYMRSTKMISSLNVRWIPLTKMSSRGKSTDDISDVLINSIQEQILYHQVSNIPVGRGLYLGYLKLASSVDLLKIVVGEKTPNMLPHAKIRDNPHVSNEEWTMIQKLTKSKSLDSLNNLESLGALENPRSAENKAAEENPGGGAEEGDGDVAGQGPSGSSTEFSEAQQLFRSQLIAALKRLFACLDIDYESSLNHRLYNAEVIEISSSVSLLVIFPPLENVCLVAGQSDKLLQRSDLIPLPVQVFEMIHLSTYQKEFITRYARLSAILEMDTILAQHNQREAFSSSEMAIAKQRMNQLSDLQSKIDSAWKGSRWVIDVVTTSRDKSASSASMRALAQLDPKSSSTESVASAEIPGRKTHNNNNHHHHHLEENQLSVHSKSDQELVPSGSASGLKFSRSENQLFNFGSGGTAPKNGSSSNASQSHHHSSAHHLFNPTAPGVRKVSVPVQSAASAKAIQEKMQFAQNIYSSHSQSDSTISNSSSSSLQQSQQQQASSTSLHNLYRQKSSSQILVPNLIVSDVGGEPVSSSSSPGAPSYPLSTPGSPIRNFTPKRTAATTTTGTTLSETPPPVPPRRTAPPPPPVPLRLDQATAAAAAATEDSRPDSGSSSGSSLVEGTDLYHPSPLSVPSVVVIQVYAAYDCGLSEGTSVKLQISNQTTARQVVDLFVRQLNSQVRGKGLEGPLYERTQDFCLVSVVGARERCLRNDFRPLLLQNPWKSGRLYVRKKNEVTAAIDLSSRD